MEFDLGHTCCNTGTLVAARARLKAKESTPLQMCPYLQSAYIAANQEETEAFPAGYSLSVSTLKSLGHPYPFGCTSRFHCNAALK